MVGEVEDEEAEDYPEESGVGVTAVKKPHVNLVEHVPSAAPHEYQAKHDSNILIKISDG